MEDVSGAGDHPSKCTRIDNFISKLILGNRNYWEPPVRGLKQVDKFFDFGGTDSLCTISKLASVRFRRQFTNYFTDNIRPCDIERWAVATHNTS